MKKSLEFKNGDNKAVKLLFTSSSPLVYGPQPYLHGGINGGQGGGGVRKSSLEVTIAVMLLLVKCYDKK